MTHFRHSADTAEASMESLCDLEMAHIGLASAARCRQEDSRSAAETTMLVKFLGPEQLSDTLIIFAGVNGLA